MKEHQAEWIGGSFPCQSIPYWQFLDNSQYPQTTSTPNYNMSMAPSNPTYPYNTSAPEVMSTTTTRVPNSSEDPAQNTVPVRQRRQPPTKKTRNISPLPPSSRNIYYRYNRQGKVEAMYRCPIPSCNRAFNCVRTASGNGHMEEGFRKDNLCKHLAGEQHGITISQKGLHGWIQQHYPDYFTAK